MKKLNKSIVMTAIAGAGLAIAMTGMAEPPKGGSSGGSMGVSAEHAKIDVEDLWKSECMGCHGKDGKGNTRAGRRAGVKDLTDAEYQESFSDEKAFKSIKEGLEDEDGKELMQPFGEDLTDTEIEALVAYLRKFDPKHPRDLSEAALKEK